MRCKPGHYSRLIPLNYLAPGIVIANLDGILPASFTRDVLLKETLSMYCA